MLACRECGGLPECHTYTRIVVTGSALADFAPPAVKFCVGSMEVVQFTGTKTAHCASVVGHQGTTTIWQ